MNGIVPARKNATPAAISHKPLRAEERVAVILSLLEPERAKQFAATMEPHALEKVIEAYENLPRVPRPVLLEVIAGFVGELKTGTPAVYGGTKQAAALASLLHEEADEEDTAPERPAHAVGGSIAPGAGSGAVWDYLQGLDPDDIARMVAAERASVIAVLLGRLPPALAGGVLAALDEEKAVSVVLQMAQGAPVSETTLEAITEALRRQAERAGDAPAEKGADALPHLTAILNRVPVARQQAVLSPLREKAAAHAEAVEEGLVRFATLHTRVPRNAVPALFRELDEDVLHKALRYGMENGNETTDFLFSNISQRLAEQIREAVLAQPVPSAEDGEAAQTRLVGLMLEWHEEGRFVLTTPE